MIPHLVLVAASVFAEPPPPPENKTKTTWAIAVGVAIDALSFAVGAALIGGDTAGFDQAKAGWITSSAGFALGPFVAHAIAGQWLRGAAFSAVPLAATIGNAAVLASQPQTIDQMDLNPDQRLVYAFTTAGLLGSVIGILDVALFKPTKIRVTPTISHAGAGLVVGGSF